MTHVVCMLTAKNRDRLRNPTLGSRVGYGLPRPCYRSLSVFRTWDNNDVLNTAVTGTPADRSPNYKPRFLLHEQYAEIVVQHVM